MTRLHLPAAVLACVTTAALLAGCGSDAGTTPATTAARTSTGSPAAPAASAKVDSKGSPGGGPCEVTDQAAVASVFPGAGAGKAGKVRNCEYTIASGPVSAVNVYLYEGTTLAEFTKQDTQNGIAFTRVDVGDGAIRDQLHTLTVQQGETLFSVQALPRTGLSAADYAKNDPQVLALATKIVASL